MSGESGKAVEVPVRSNSSTTLPIPTTPPKRFLGASHAASQRKGASGSLGSSALPSAKILPVLKIQPTSSSSSAAIVSPPKLTRFPTLVLTPVDITKLPGKDIVSSLSAPSVPSSGLPRPPPLIKMPLSTRKDKRAAAAAIVTKNEETESVVDDTDKQPEPPRKRTRATTEKSGESSSSTVGGGVVTPRKIIQEIFGPDKSKKPKGKGRKKRRGAPTPRKKVLQDEPTTVENIEAEDDSKSKEECERHEENTNENDLRDVEELGNEKVQNVEDKEKQNVGDDEEMPNLEQQEKLIEVDLTEDAKSAAEKVKGGDEEDETSVVHEEEENEIEELVEEKEEEDVEKIDGDNDSEKNVDGETEEEDQDQNENEEPEESEEKPQILPRRASRRKAKSVANEKLKRLSKSEDVDGNRKATSSTGTPEDPEDVNQEEEEQQQREKEEVEEEEDNNSTETKEETGGPASIHSRRSTTEGSSKSFGSSIQLDLESSYHHHSHFHHRLNKFTGHDEDGYRQKYNPTPLSLISEDDFGKDDDEGPLGDNVSESDMHDQKDSDVDSTYSWKPVRAAAAAALEQVTKNQGSASGDLGDAEAKAAAAAERRARKIMRYKGRNRRSLLFKSSSSKRYTAVRNNRYSAQPTIAPKVYHHGHYFQAGDIVSVELADSTYIHGQVRGLIMDHFGEISAGIRFLAPKHPTYAFMDFEPHNYAFRYDIPEKLLKIEYIEFVMHLNLDYFDGQPSFSKIEKGTMYTRIGKTVHSHSPAEMDNIGGRIGGGESSSSTSSSDDSDDDDSSTSSSDSENDEKKEKDEKNVKGECHRHQTDSSTDADAEVEEDNNTLQKNKDEAHEDKPCADGDDVKIKDEIENISPPVSNNDNDTKIEVDSSV